MKKLCWGRSIGVYYSGDLVSITEVGNTVRGRTILNQQTTEITEQDQVQCLSKILNEFLKTHGGKNVPVSIGLKPEQTFFVTIAAAYEHDKQLRDKLLELAGFHNETERNNIVFDYFKINKLKTSLDQLWSIGVCDKQLADKLYAALDQTGLKNISLKPTPLSLSTVSIKMPSKCKGWKCFIKIYLNKTDGLAILMLGNNPICWRRFTFSHSNSHTEIESAIMTFLVQKGIKINQSEIDGFVLAGHDADRISKKLFKKFKIEAVAVDKPGFSDSYCSYCLAISAKSKEIQQLDMFREIRKKPGILQIFPWKTAAMIVFLSCLMAFTMWQKNLELIKYYNNIKKENLTHKWSNKKNTPDIISERKKLLAEVESVTKFLSTRIIWSDYLRDLPTRLPPNVNLSHIWALCELKESSKNEDGQKPKKSLMLRGTTSFDLGRAAPEEIDTFLESLKKVELLQRDFPKVQLGEIKYRREAQKEMATFMVLALPKTTEKDGEAKEVKDKNSGS